MGCDMVEGFLREIFETIQGAINFGTNVVNGEPRLNLDAAFIVVGTNFVAGEIIELTFES